MFLRLVLTAVFGATTCAALHAQAVLARNVDMRPLPEVSRESLSPAMRKALRALEAEMLSLKALPARDEDGTVEHVPMKIHRIPVAPREHKAVLRSAIRRWSVRQPELSPDCV